MRLSLLLLGAALLLSACEGLGSASPPDGSNPALSCEAPGDAEAAFAGAIGAPEITASEDETPRYIVQFEAETGPTPSMAPRIATDGVSGAHRRLVESRGAEVVRPLRRRNAIVARMRPDEADALARSPGVARVELDPKRRPFAQSVPWGIGLTQAPEVWNETGPAVGAMVCVVDSGLYAPHSDLQQPKLSGYPAGWDDDRCGHGTHVAGTIAAIDDFDGVVGINPRGVPLHVVKVFDDECGWGYASDLVDALDQCRAAGAQVVNLSLGGDRPSDLERRAFEDAWRAGMVVVAAAGNGGTTTLEYPASYPSVISVAAADERLGVAGFSQRNPQVDVTAPGVRIPSTIGTVSRHELTVGDRTFRGNTIDRSGTTAGVSGTLVDGGLCKASSTGWSGKIVACRRGENTFAEKVSNAERSGAIGVAVYNHEIGPFAGTLGESSSNVPAIALSGEDGQALTPLFGQEARLVSEPSRPGSGYATMSGTSMAAPHVTGVAALLWGQNRAWTNAEIRNAIEGTAHDLGARGRDDATGYGLVQAHAALGALQRGVGRSAPYAGFFVSCEGLSCELQDTSLDGVGEISERRFLLGDGTTRTEAQAVHRYAGPGPYTVTLEVTNDLGMQSRIALPVSAITLEAIASTADAEGRRKVELHWKGAAGDRVLVVRNGTVLGTTNNSGAATHTVSASETGKAASYRVCDLAGDSCSPAVNVAPLCAP